jgi:hypothetical protein
MKDNLINQLITILNIRKSVKVTYIVVRREYHFPLNIVTSSYNYMIMLYNKLIV